MRRCEVCGESHATKDCSTLIRPVAGGAAAQIATPRRSLAGQTLGPYQLSRELGAGAFATVYFAEHAVVGTPVAIKVLHEDLCSDAHLVQRFVGEARATSLIQHENVIRIHDISITQPGRYYIVLEYLQGETLAAACERGPMPPSVAAPLFLQICSALSTAHRLGVVHRDLKPDNIYLVPSEDPQAAQVKVMDFGIARRSVLQAGEQRTQIGQVLGTPQYLSPEQSIGLAVDSRSDIYSLGVILFRALTGQLPFNSPSVGALIAAHRTEPPPLPSSIESSISPRWEKVILKALEKAREVRFQTMDEFGQAIAAALCPVAPIPLTEVVAVQPEPELLRRIEATSKSEPYKLLDVADDAELGQIREATQKLSLAFARLGEEPTLAAFRPRLEAALQSIAMAEEQLVDCQARANFDARRGNFRGVGRAIAAGLDAEQASALRSQLLAGRPEVHLVSATGIKEADALMRANKREQAGARVVDLLRVDPLNLDLQKRYWRMRGAR